MPDIIYKAYSVEVPTGCAKIHQQKKTKRADHPEPLQSLLLQSTVRQFWKIHVRQRCLTLLQRLCIWTASIQTTSLKCTLERAVGFSQGAGLG